MGAKQPKSIVDVSDPRYEARLLQICLLQGGSTLRGLRNQDLCKEKEVYSTEANLHL
jgi:hypothetical protein